MFLGAAVDGQITVPVRNQPSLASWPRTEYFFASSASDVVNDVISRVKWQLWQQACLLKHFVQEQDSLAEEGILPFA